MIADGVLCVPFLTINPTWSQVVHTSKLAEDMAKRRRFFYQHAISLSHDKINSVCRGQYWVCVRCKCVDSGQRALPL